MASYVLFISKPNAATDLLLTRDDPSHDLKSRTKQSHLSLERTRQTMRLSLLNPPHPAFKLPKPKLPISAHCN